MMIFADKKAKYLILLVAVNLVFSTSFPDKTDNENVNEEKMRHSLASLERKNLYDLVTERIIDSAIKYIGVPHRMGGTTYQGMDCSGLLVTAFRENGIYLPRSCKDLSCCGIVINEKNN